MTLLLLTSDIKDDRNHLRELRDVIYSGKCILLTGIGLSAHVRTRDGRKPPKSLKGLMEEFIYICLKEGFIKRSEEDKFADLFRRELLKEAGYKIEEHLTDKSIQAAVLRHILLYRQIEANRIHRLLARIPFRAYINTGYDTYIEDAYYQEYGYSLTKIYKNSLLEFPALYSKNRPFILKVHGDIENPRSLSFGKRSFKELFEAGHGRNLLKELSGYSILSIGFEQADTDLDNLGYLLKQLELVRKLDRHWIVVPETQLLSLKSEFLWNHPGTNIIPYEPSENSFELTYLLEQLAIGTSPAGRVSNRNTTLKNHPAGKDHETLPPYPSIILPSSFDNSKNQKQASEVLDKERNLLGYFSYSPKGEKLKQELEQQLLGTQFEGVKIDWQDGQVTAGEEWETEITNRLNNAHVILLLINAEYLVSFVSSRIEMTTALKRHKNKKARVIPIILGSCSWRDHAFYKLQYLPRDGKAVNLLSAPRREKVFQGIILDIKKSIKELEI